MGKFEYFDFSFFPFHFNVNNKFTYLAANLLEQNVVNFKCDAHKELCPLCFLHFIW